MPIRFQRALVSSFVALLAYRLGIFFYTKLRG